MNPRVITPQDYDAESTVTDRYAIARGPVVFAIDGTGDTEPVVIPTGDLAAIIERGLDLLIEQTLKRRFGMTSRNPKRTRTPASATSTSENTTSAPDSDTRWLTWPYWRSS